MDEVRIVYYYRKLKVPAQFTDFFFLGMWGLKVTRNKEFLVIPHMIYIYRRDVCYCLGRWLNYIYT